MRTKNIIRNVIFSMFFFLASAILAFVIRKCVAAYLGAEVLGYEGLFGNIFTLLSLADLGAGTIIAYRMYPAFVANDKTQINYLLAVYRWLYRWIGIIILVIGIVLMPFLDLIVKDNTLSKGYLMIVFLLHLGGTLCSYFLAYKRIIPITDQHESECMKVDLVCTIISGFLQIGSVLIFRSYIFYLFWKIANNFISNIWLSRKVDKTYTYLDKDTRITIADVQKLGIGKDLGNTFVRKVCRVIHSSTDNIIISSLMGITHVGLLSNYIMIHNYVFTIINRILKPLQASIGNLNYTVDKEKSSAVFNMFDLLGFWIAAFSVCGYVVLLNSFINWWLGIDYLLSENVVFLLALLQYVSIVTYFTDLYRDTIGKFELDRNWFIAGAVVNLILSIVLIKPMGFEGVLLGTLFGQLCFAIGETKVLYAEFLHERLLLYVLRQVRNIVVLVVEVFLVLWISGMTNEAVQNRILSLIVKLLIVLIVPNAINILIFARSKEEKLMMVYAKRIFGMLRSRLKGGSANGE